MRTISFAILLLTLCVTAGYATYQVIGREPARAIPGAGDVRNLSWDPARE